MLVPVSSRLHGLSGYVLVPTIPNTRSRARVPWGQFKAVARKLSREITGYLRAILSRLSDFVLVQYISTFFYHKL